MYVQLHHNETKRLEQFQWYKDKAVIIKNGYRLVPVEKLIETLLSDHDQLQYLRGGMNIISKQLVVYKTHNERAAYVSKYKDFAPGYVIIYDRDKDRIEAYDQDDNLILTI